MNTDDDVLLKQLREIRKLIDQLINFREREIDAYRWTKGFNPDDTTRKEED